jgi:dCTP deaminase
MIMGYRDLYGLWKTKRIQFSPDIDPKKQIGLASIDLRLGYKYTKQKPAPGLTIDPFDESFDPTPIIETVDLQTQPVGQIASYVLKPNDFVLFRTLEEIKIPLGFAAQVQGTTTGARPGLSIHATAPHINPGFAGSITLEIKNLGIWDLRLLPGKRICQLIVFKVKTPPSRKEWQAMTSYQNQTVPWAKRQVGARASKSK